MFIFSLKLTYCWIWIV